MAYSANDDLILAALKAGDALTPAVAAQRWGCLALHSAIARLRKAGNKISTRMVGGFGEYRLLPAAGAHGKAAMGDREAPRASQEVAPRATRSPSAAPSEYTVGQQYRMFGRRVLILADGISNYDGTRFTEVRDLGPA